MLRLASGALLALPVLAAVASPMMKRAIPFFNPVNGGGSWLDDAGVGVGEPLNVVISGESSADVLTDDGIVNFARAIGFSEECLDIHLGDPQSANLGDGNGWVNQTIEIRQDFGAAGLGTCLETLVGGNHFRVYRQNGSLEDTGALFLAVSKEEDLSEGHTIVPNGYNIGRDELVSAAVSGTPSFHGTTYAVATSTLVGVMPSGSAGVNHGIAVDGNAILLTVTSS